MLPADEGHTIRVRATLSRAGQQLLSCESAPALVVAADAPRPGEEGEGGGDLPPEPAVPTEAVLPVALEPSQWQPSYSESDEGAAGAAETDALAQPAPAASEPVVSINLSSDVLLIGGAAVLVVLGAAAIFGRSES